MKIKIEEAKEKVERFLETNGLKHADAVTLAKLMIDQELIGNQFSPIGELAGKHQRLVSEAGQSKEEVVVDKTSAKLIKGNGRLAPLITADYLDIAVKAAKKQGVFALGIYDSTYNDFFDVFCRRVAEQDCLAIIVENGGPQGVVPFGGKKDITGTNPIAYGIPTNKYPIVFDAATAVHAYGRIRQAKESNEQLPDNAYVDKEGNITTDPHKAHAVLPFGGFKGYAINLLIDVLSGCLVRGRSGLDQPEDSQRFIGTFIVIIDPASFGDIELFKKSTTKLMRDILNVPPVDKAKPVRVPGQRGSERRIRLLAEGVIEIEDDCWQKFVTAYEKIVK